MPRYFFHSADGTLDIDDEGSDLPSLGAAQAEAARLAGTLLRDDPQALWERGSWRVEVTDERGALQFTIVTVAVDAHLRRTPTSVARDGG